MILFPLTSFEEIAIQWVARVVAPTATAIILLLGAVSVAAAQG